LKARAILLVFAGPKNRRDLCDSNDPGVPDGAGFAFILRWSAPPDKPDAAADRSGAATPNEMAIVLDLTPFTITQG